MSGTEEDRRRFILDHTDLKMPPLVPEVALHLAGDVMNLWSATNALDAARAASLDDLPPPYWAFAWPGGQALARYLLDTPSEVAGKNVLDFGSGSGLVAIAAAKAGAARVCAAEIDSLARTALALNARANGVSVAIIADDIIGTETQWDAVLVGDMCYEQPLAGRLIAWLHKLSANDVCVRIGDPGRTYFHANGLARLATYAVPTSRDLEDHTIRETSVYRVLPSA
jgi:predicted nicotinamide N-methyase